MKKLLLILGAATALVAVSCMKTETTTMSGNLKAGLSTGVTAVNDAVNSISSSAAYGVLNANSVALKSATDLSTTFADSVTLASVAGIYDFQPDLFHFYDFCIPHRMFVKTGTSDHLIVNLPQKLVFHPRFLHELNPADTTLKNDFRIDASDYYYFFNFTNLFNYRLSASFTLDTASIGEMQVLLTANLSSLSNANTFTFPGGYVINTSQAVANDTLTKVFSLTKGTDVLLKETVIASQLKPGMGEGRGIDEEFRHRERLYILDIGNVEIRRGNGLDSIQVYLNGVLQQHAGAKIVDSTGTDGSFFHKRDILLTFDDGTTTNLNTLLDPARQALSTLVDALQSMNFAKNIVDYIAIGIDWHMRHDHD